MEVPAAITGEKPHISVYLSNTREDQIKYFHCLLCGHKVFGYYSDTKILLAGEGQFSKSPITVQCNGAITVFKEDREITTRCKAIYFIA